MIYYDALSIFIFKISPLKSCSHMVYKWVSNFHNTHKIWLLFTKNKFFFRFDYKMGSKLSQVMWFECFMSLTHKNYAICMYRWKCWWKCFKMLWYFKIPKDCNTFIIFETLKQTMSLHTIFSLSLTIKPSSCCIYIYIYIYVSIQKGSFNMHLMHFEIFNVCNYKYNLNWFHSCNKGKCFIKINVLSVYVN